MTKDWVVNAVLKRLRISQRLYGVMLLLIICIGVLGGTSRFMLHRVAAINALAQEALAHMAMLDELEIAHLDFFHLSFSFIFFQTLSVQLYHIKFALGSWYYTFTASPEFAALSPQLRQAYQALAEPHEQLHRSAVEISTIL